jgi:hypothetical protein
VLEEADIAEWPLPEWEDELTLVAAAVDLVSHRRFRVWYDEAEALRRVSRLRRARRRPLLVESVETGVAIARLASWEDAVAWHDHELISAGWVVVGEIPDPEPAAAPALEPLPRSSTPGSRP